MKRVVRTYGFNNGVYTVCVEHSWAYAGGNDVRVLAIPYF